MASIERLAYTTLRFWSFSSCAILTVTEASNPIQCAWEEKRRSEHRTRDHSDRSRWALLKETAAHAALCSRYGWATQLSAEWIASQCELDWEEDRGALAWMHFPQAIHPAEPR